MYLGLDKNTLVEATGTYVAKPLPVPVNAPPSWLNINERRLIEALRSYKWGEATVVLKDGKPVMLKGLREDVKLTDDR